LNNTRASDLFFNFGVFRMCRWDVILGDEGSDDDHAFQGGAAFSLSFASEDVRTQLF
jgi:hypothetical protein